MNWFVFIAALGAVVIFGVILAFRAR